MNVINNSALYERTSAMSNKDIENSVIRLMEGEGVHDSLGNAALYSTLMEDTATMNALTDLLGKRCELVREMCRLNAEAGGALLPPIVPADESLEAFIAVEILAKNNPGLHPILGQIAELEKARFLAGAAGQAH